MLSFNGHGTRGGTDDPVRFVRCRPGPSGYRPDDISIRDDGNGAVGIGPGCRVVTVVRHAGFAFRDGRTGRSNRHADDFRRMSGQNRRYGAGDAAQGGGNIRISRSPGGGSQAEPVNGRDTGVAARPGNQRGNDMLGIIRELPVAVNCRVLPFATFAVAV
jgi:hypothetical protein